MEIEPVRADLAQVTRGRDGRMVEIDPELHNIAADLKQINPHFRVRWSEAGEYFVIYYRPEGEELGSGYVITNVQELDQRVVTLLRKISWRMENDHSYSLADEIEANEAAADKAKDHEMSEKYGEMYERLAHAIRQDLQTKNKIFVP